jgi:hypothetical protein
VIQTSLPDDEPDGGAHSEGGAAPAGRAPAPPTRALPADPAAYDSERNAAARARGLSAPYIPGGRDPDQATADREDRRNLRILGIMVVVIVLAGFVLGALAALAGLTGLVGGSG